MSNSESVQDKLQQAVARLEALAAKAEQGKGQKSALEQELGSLRARETALKAELEDAKATISRLQSDLMKLGNENTALRDGNAKVADRLDRAIDQLKILVAA